MDKYLNLNVQVSQKYIIFPQIHYPFINVLINTPKIYKTSLNLTISNDQIDKVMHFNHKNIINIHKIARGNSKNVKKQSNAHFYFFYYEYIPFSLKQIIQTNQSSQNNKKVLQRLINNKNTISEILKNVSEYLIQQDIQYIFDLEHIGVNSQGQIKVYVSPKLFFEKKHQLSRKIINNSIDSVIRWWNSHINIFLLAKIRKSLKFNAGNNSSEKQLKRSLKPERKSTNDVYKIKDLQQKSNPISNLKKDSKTVNQMKIKKLNDQIMDIKKRLNQKRRHKQSQNLIQSRKDLQQNYFNPYQSQCFTHTADHVQDNNLLFPVKETVQQNINCINIYTNSPNQTIQNVLANKNKRMSTQHIYSYAFAPAEPKQHYPAENHLYPELDDFRRSAEDDESVDTYDMEVQIEVEPAKALNMIYNSSTGQRQSSQRNFKSKQFQSAKPLRNNQVSNNFATESAGPIQMKKLFNTYLKPQFLPKRSNIYEDLGQYESETSKSISNKKYIKELFQAGKSVNSFHQNSSSLYSKSKEQEVIQANINNANKMMKKDNLLFAQNNINHQQKIPIKIVEKQKKIQQNFASQAKFKSKIAHDNNLQEVTDRVHQILQKTRRALQMLNKLKQTRKNLNCKFVII